MRCIFILLIVGLIGLDKYDQTFNFAQLHNLPIIRYESDYSLDNLLSMLGCLQNELKLVFKHSLIDLFKTLKDNPQRS